MNKNVAKIVALALTISAFSAIAPTSISKTIIQKAEASSNDYLEGITVETSSGKELKLYDDKDCKSKDKIDDDDDLPSTFYAKATSGTSKIKITDLDFDSNCELDEITKGSKDYDEDDKIPISSGTTSIKIKVKNTDDNKTKTYTLKVIKDSKDDDDDDDDDDNYDDIYIDDIEIKNGSKKIDFNFSKKKTSFDITVDNDVSYVKITAEPEDDDNDDIEVKIDGKTYDDDDDWESDKISLSEGKNSIVVKVEDTEEDEERKYTLNITRKSKTTTTTTNSSTSTTTTSTNNTTNTTTTTTANKNGWVKSGTGWNYYLNGVMQKNQLFYDRTYGKNYYVDVNGVMATGWRKINSTWYYFDNSGAMKTGWVLSNGKWYFLDTNGKMLANTVVSGYKLGADGAWIR